MFARAELGKWVLKGLWQLRTAVTVIERIALSLDQTVTVECASELFLFPHI